MPAAAWTAPAPRPAWLFINREFGWLAFNRRVLAEARNPDNPVLERVRFLSITASNLDEFFMVRYAQIRHRALRGDAHLDPAGMALPERMCAIAEDARDFMDEQLDVLAEELFPALHPLGLRPWGWLALSEAQRLWAETVFTREILPVLAPYIPQRGSAFPKVAGRLLQFGLLITPKKGPERPVLATVQAPAGMRRLFRMPEEIGEGFVYLEDMVAAFAARLVPGYRVIECHPYRVTRDEDYVVPESSEADELVAETRKSLRKRKTGAVVRLEVAREASGAFVQALIAALDVRTEAVYRLDGPLGLTFLGREIANLPEMDALRYAPFTGKMPARLMGEGSIFDILQGGDVFLHHPYDSFDAVQRFVREAASDPRVLAINMTLYRVSGQSPIIRALSDAAEAGKRVTVLLEVKARFDEANNLRWAEVLRRAGCVVIYGMPRLKTHSKIALIVRREGEGLARYMHLGTGNYNDVTAKLYTDMGLLTADAALGEDAQAFFNMITGFSREPVMRRLIYAPRMLRQSLTALIEAEIAHARAGRSSGIMAKMNSLTDPGIIGKLYEASAAGVDIRLIVRGVCCLRAGVPGLSDRIEVRSIVGRFLEHSRIFRFENGGDARLYLSSADWMPRNLNRRVELMFPIQDAASRSRVQAVLDIQWRDNAKAWRMLADGSYERMPRGTPHINAQEALIISDGPFESAT